MSSTITWTVEWMQCKPTEGQYSDVVINAGWRCNGAQVAGGTTYSGTVASSVSFTQSSEGGSFTPYADLTQEQVLGWCWESGVDKTVTEAAVQKQIDDQINPPVVTPKLPWA